MTQLTCSERHYTRPEVTGMEGNINSREGNRSKPALEFDVTLSDLLFQCTLMTRFDDISQHFFNFLDGIGFSQLVIRVSR